MISADGEHLGIDRDPREHRQPRPGAARTGRRLFVPELDVAVRGRDEGRAAARAVHELGGDTMAEAEAGPEAHRAPDPGPAERRDHREAAPSPTPARPQHAKEQNVVANVKRLADAFRRAGRAGDPRLVHRREGRARPEAERAALRGRQGHERARPRHRGARRPPTGLEPKHGDLVVEKMRMSAWQGTKLETCSRASASTRSSSPAPGRTCRSSTRPAPARTRATTWSCPRTAARR